jgi:hypothetical protein
MSSLFVANATKLIQEIVYRLPETPSARRQTIRPGEQVELRNLSLLDVETIIRQNIVYGWTDAAAVDRAKPYVGIVYAVDRPIVAGKIMSAIEHNIAVLNQRGKENRELAAVASNNLLEAQVEMMNNSHMNETQTKLNRMEMAIVEEDSRSKSAELSEVFRVDRNAEAPRAEGKAAAKRASGRRS